MIIYFLFLIDFFFKYIKNFTLIFYLSYLTLPKLHSIPPPYPYYTEKCFNEHQQLCKFLSLPVNISSLFEQGVLMEDLVSRYVVSSLEKKKTLLRVLFLSQKPNSISIYY